MAPQVRKKNPQTVNWITYPTTNDWQPRAPIDSLNYTPNETRFFAEYDNQERAGFANSIEPALSLLRNNPKNNALKEAIRQKLPARESTAVAGKDANTAQQNLNASKGMYLTEREQIMAQRAENKRRRQSARTKTGGFNPVSAKLSGADISVDDISDYYAGAGDTGRLFPDDHDSFIDDYLNPAVAFGDMQSGLADVPKDIRDGNYLSAAINVAAPIVEIAGYATGAGGATKAATKSAKDIAKKAVKVHANTEPLRDKLRHFGAKRAFTQLKEEPWRINPWSYDPPGENYMFRGIDPEAELDIYNSELLRPRDNVGKTPFPKYSKPEDPHKEMQGISFPVHEKKNLFASRYLDRAEEFGTSHGDARRVVEFPRDVSNRWRSKYGYDEPGTGPTKHPKDWSEYTPITENFQGVPGEKVRVLKPDKYKRYVETDESINMRKRIKDRLGKEGVEPQGYMYRGLGYRGLRDAYESGVLRAPRNSPFAGVKEADPHAYSEWTEYATPTQEVYWSPYRSYASHFGQMSLKKDEYGIYARVPKNSADFKVGVSWDGERVRQPGEAPWVPEDGSDFSQWTDTSIPIEKAEFYKSKIKDGYQTFEKIDPSDVYKWLDWKDYSGLWDEGPKVAAPQKQNLLEKLKSKLQVSKSKP